MMLLVFRRRRTKTI